MKKTLFNLLILTGLTFAFFGCGADKPKIRLGISTFDITPDGQHIIYAFRKNARMLNLDYGIGRWAIVDKGTGNFVGWGGLKFRTDEVNGHINFYEVGYRLLRRYWGQGFATESARASLKYAFNELQLDAVYAMANVENLASKNALLKSGLVITGQLSYEGIACDWFEIKQEDWRNYCQ